MSDFFDQVLDNWSAELKQTIKRNKAGIEAEVKRLIKKHFEASPTYKELLNGLLKSELGIVRGTEQSVLTQLTMTLMESVEVKLTQKPKRAGKGINFTLSIEGADIDSFANHLAGIVTSSKGREFNWLDFLTFKGSTVILQWGVKDANVFERRNFSRSGEKIMVKGAARRFSVRPQHHGTERSNWISRSLFGYEDELSKVIERGLGK